MNSPHPAIFQKRLRTLEQLRASYYMFLFQLPRLPERLVSAADFRPLRNMLKYQPKKRGAFDDEDVQRYLEAIKKPGALTAGLNYYRATGRQAMKGQVPAPKKLVERPVLLLWGLDDAALPPPNLDGVEQLVRDIKVVKIPGCSHWVQHDAPEVIVNEALAFFGPVPAAAGAAESGGALHVAPAAMAAQAP